MGWIILIVVIVLILLWVVSTYNSLIGLKNKVKDNWAQVDVLLKQRADEIPNLVETVKGYTSHEKGTLEAVINARNKAVSATTKDEEMAANGELTQALGRLFALTEAYPDLKANTNFMDLQTKLDEIEKKIAFSRQFYNDIVMKYNNKVQMVPSNIVAGLFHFKEEKFFEATEEEKKVPQVKF